MTVKIFDLKVNSKVVFWRKS